LPANRSYVRLTLSTVRAFTVFPSIGMSAAMMVLAALLFLTAYALRVMSPAQHVTNNGCNHTHKQPRSHEEGCSRSASALLPEISTRLGVNLSLAATHTLTPVTFYFVI
jgi:hypothetical protein